MSTTPEWAFKIPPSLGGGNFVMREVSLDEVERNTDAAIATAGTDERKLMRAGAAVGKENKRSSLVSWKDVPVPQDNGREAFWARLRAKERALIDIAYDKLHKLDDDDEAYLVESMQPAGKDGGASE